MQNGCKDFAGAMFIMPNREWLTRRLRQAAESTPSEKSERLVNPEGGMEGPVLAEGEPLLDEQVGANNELESHLVFTMSHQQELHGMLTVRLCSHCKARRNQAGHMGVKCGRLLPHLHSDHPGGAYR